MNLSEKLIKLSEAKNVRKISESGVSEDAMFASYLFIVSEKGKLANKEIYAWLKGSVGSNSDEYKDIEANPRGIAVDGKKLADMLEDYNNHDDAQIIRLLMKKEVKKAVWLTQVVDEKQKIGHSPLWLKTLSFLADDDAYVAKIVKELEETVKDIGKKYASDHNVSDASQTPAKFWAILKDHPDKDVVKKITELKDMLPLESLFMGVKYASSDKNERMKIVNAFKDLARTLNKELKDGRVTVNGPVKDPKEMIHF